MGNEGSSSRGSEGRQSHPSSDWAHAPQHFDDRHDPPPPYDWHGPPPPPPMFHDWHVPPPPPPSFHVWHGPPPPPPMFHDFWHGPPPPPPPQFPFRHPPPPLFDYWHGPPHFPFRDPPPHPPRHFPFGRWRRSPLQCEREGERSHSHLFPDSSEEGNSESGQSETPRCSVGDNLSRIGDNPSETSRSSRMSAGQLRCPVCLDNHKDMALGCGHMLCSACLQVIEDRTPASPLCPICRRPIEIRHSIFL